MQQPFYAPVQPPVIVTRSRSPRSSRRSRSGSQDSTNWSRPRYPTPSPILIAPSESSEPPVIIVRPYGTDLHPPPHPGMVPGGVRYYLGPGQVQPYVTDVYPPFINGMVPDGSIPGLGIQAPPVQPDDLSHFGVGPADQSRVRKVVNRYISLFRKANKTKKD